MPKAEPKKRPRRATVTAKFALTWDGRLASPAGSATCLTGHVGRGRPPLRLVVSDSGRLDPHLAIAAGAAAPLVIFSTSRLPAATRAVLAPLGDLWLHEGRTVRLREMLETLRADYGVQRVICEDGGPLLRRLLDAALVDELRLTLRPQLGGGPSAATLTGVAGPFLARSIPFTLHSLKVLAGECVLRYRVGRP